MTTTIARPCVQWNEHDLFRLWWRFHETEDTRSHNRQRIERVMERLGLKVPHYAEGDV